MSKLEEAILLATVAHLGQIDKSGMPYVLHPLRIMTKMKTESEMMAAVLHDVVEDTGWTLEQLRKKGFPEEVLNAVECLTHREGEDYMASIRRAKANQIARRVKVADIEDNMDLSRITNFTKRDEERIAKYKIARQLLTESEEN